MGIKKNLGVGRKWPTIDLVKLMQNMTKEKWHKFLYKCYQAEDMETLKKTLYGVQAGMKKLEKEKLNTEKASVWFLGVQHSVEMAIKSLLKKKRPSLLDDSKNVSQFDPYIDVNAELEKKRQRDREFESILRECSF